MAAANMAPAYDQLDPETKLKMIKLPNSPCCFNIAMSEEKLNCCRSGYEEYMDLVQGLEWKQLVSFLTQSSTSPEVLCFFSAMDKYQDPFLEHLYYIHPLALAAKLADSDTPTLKQATRGSNADGFWEAMLVEIVILFQMKAFKLVPHTTCMHVIMSTWAFCVKCFPTGLICKFKAWFCCHGDQKKKGVDYFDTFAPVVSLNTVRVLLILLIILNLSFAQVDYTYVSVQSAIDTIVYISMPKGWQFLNEMGLPIKFKEGHILKLNRSLYGLKQYPHNLFEFLKKKLLHCGFVQC
eukprot:9854213-Ditylum_brightwellii.AAC.1